MRGSEIRQMETSDILGQLEAKRQELYNQRIAFVMGTLSNANELKLIRKDIARMLTELRARELAAEIVKGEK